MSAYHIKVVKGRSETVHPCDGYTVTTVPNEGTYADNPEIIGIPKGQKVKLELSPSNKVILLPRDGRIAFVMSGEGKSKGDTIDSYPKKRDRQIRNLEE